MTLIAPPTTPTVGLARELRRLGLTQGRGGDFRVTGEYRNGERLYTYVVVYSRHAEEVIAANADEIEERTDASGFPFRVSVRYSDSGRPFTSIMNSGPRVRETAPVAVEAAPVAPVAEPVVEQPAAAIEEPAAETALEEPAVEESAVETVVEEPAVDVHDEHRLEEQAAALHWSTRHADLVTWAAAGQLLIDAAGVLRRVTAPGRVGRRVAATPLDALTDAWFLTVGDPDDGGRRHITPTVDGRRALAAWERVRPTPVELPRNRWREPLRPLRGGEEQARRSRAFWAEEERRCVERARWLAEWEKRAAAEELQERMRQAWACVEGVPFTHTWRKRPTGWVPTDEEVARYSLDADVVAALRDEVGELCASA